MYVGVFAMFWALDNIPVVLEATDSGERAGWVSWAVSHTVLAVGTAMNAVVGRRMVDDTAVPVDVWNQWRSGGDGKRC